MRVKVWMFVAKLDGREHGRCMTSQIQNRGNGTDHPVCMQYLTVWVYNFLGIVSFSANLVDSMG
jgi:hypothetical protein